MTLNEVEIWRLNETRKETDTVHGRLFKKLTELPKNSASGIAEIELGRGNRKGKVIGFRENYWQPNANMDIANPMR